jgi:uncharacterized protein (TIGR00369 family)
MTNSVGAALVARMKAGNRPPCSQFLDSEPLDIDTDAGTARMAFTAPPEFCNYMGVVHGGFLAAMLDEAMAIAAVATRDFQQAVPTLAMKVSYLIAVRPGRLTAEGRLIGGGRSTAFLEGRLYDGENRLCATASATARFVERPVL